MTVSPGNRVPDTQTHEVRSQLVCSHKLVSKYADALGSGDRSRAGESAYD